MRVTRARIRKFVQRTLAARQNRPPPTSWDYFRARNSDGSATVACTAVAAAIAPFSLAPCNTDGFINPATHYCYRLRRG